MPEPAADGRPFARQGDVLRADRLPIVIAPAHPLTPDEGEAPDRGPLTTMEVLIPTRLTVLVTQDCDIARSAIVEPYVVGAPLRALSAADARASGAGRQSMRYWRFPDPDGLGRVLVVDARLFFTLSKGVLSAVPMVGDVLQDPERASLRRWLGARLGRAGWDRHVERKLIRPVERAVAAIASSRAVPGARVLSAVRFVGLRQTPGRADCSVLMVTDPVALRRAGADAAAVTGVGRALYDEVHRRVAAAGGTYIPRCVIADATTISAADLLEHAPVDIDLPVDEDDLG